MATNKKRVQVKTYKIMGVIKGTGMTALVQHIRANSVKVAMNRFGKKYGSVLQGDWGFSVWLEDKEMARKDTLVKRFYLTDVSSIQVDGAVMVADNKELKEFMTGWDREMSVRDRFELHEALEIVAI